MNIIFEKYLDENYYRTSSFKPDFDNFLRMLRGEKTSRPVLFEFSIDRSILERAVPNPDCYGGGVLDDLRLIMAAYKNLGYDYMIMNVPGLRFKQAATKKLNTKSLNESPIITDWESFEKFEWPDPESANYSVIEDLAKELPEGMKIIVRGPDGVLENVINLTGFDNLCYMMVDEPELVEKLFECVGSRMEKYYGIASEFDAVGALVCNDDWGFKTQTMFSLQQMREYVIPWHRKIVQTIKKTNKPVILHSCGQLSQVMDDIIDDIGYSGKHSFEDTIIPVEEAYELWSDRISIIGGIDVDFLCRSTPEEIFNRSMAMLQRTQNRGRYALGSGNSIPAYVPRKNFFAMIAAANCLNA